MAYTPDAQALDFAHVTGYVELDGGHLDFPEAQVRALLSGAATVGVGAAGSLAVGAGLQGAAGIGVTVSADLKKYAPSALGLDFALVSGWIQPEPDAVDFPGAPPSVVDSLILGKASAAVVISASGSFRTGARFEATASISVSATADLKLRFFQGTATVSTQAAGNLSTTYFVGHATVSVSAFALGLAPDLGLGTGVNGPPVGFPWVDAPPKQISRVSPYEMAEQINIDRAGPWTLATAVDDEGRLPWLMSAEKDHEILALFGELTRWVDELTAGLYGFPTPTDRAIAASFPNILVPREREREHSWIWLRDEDRESTAPYELADPYGEPYYKEPPYSPPSGSQVDFTSSSSLYVAPSGNSADFNLRPEKPNRRAVATEHCPLPHSWGFGTPEDDQAAFPWDPEIRRIIRDPKIQFPTNPTPPIIDDPNGPPNLPRYFIMPAVTIVRLPERAPIECNAATVRTERGSWGWSLAFNPSTREDMALITPDPITGPRIVEVTINDHIWEFLVERYSSKFTHAGGHQFAASGRGRAALLSSKYAPLTTYTEDNIRTVAQLADQVLVNTGWTLSWEAPDWLVPAGVFSYQNLAPMDVLSRLARAVGARVIAHTSESQIRVIADYPLNPWTLGWSADHIIPHDVVTALSGEWSPGPGYNSIHVVGKEQGIIVNATITGSGGTNPAPMVIDSLITHVDAGRERGRVELARSASRTNHSMTLPLFPPPSVPQLILPGDLCEVGEGVETWVGLATGVVVSAKRTSALTVRQSIALEKYSG